MTKKIIPSPITSIGGKLPAIKEFGLHEFIPPLTDNHFVFEELFAGTCVMFFNIQTKSAIINDKNSDIFNFWKMIQTKCNQFEKELEFVWLGQKWFQDYQQRTDDIGKAVFFYICNRTARNGIYVNNREKWLESYKPKPFRKNFTLWKEKMDNTYLQIHNNDYAIEMENLNNHESKDRDKYFIFQDPIYPEKEKLYDTGRKEKKEIIKNDNDDKFTWEDQVKLAELNFKSPHHILQTNRNCKEIRILYKDWYKLPARWSYFSHVDKGVNKYKDDEYPELLLSNKPIVRYRTDGSNIPQKISKKFTIDNIITNHKQK